MKIFPFLYKSLPRWLILCFLLLGSVLTEQVARAAGPCTTLNIHGGVISADESWCSHGGNTHYLTSDVIVQAGVTLTIAPGVTVDSTADAWSKYLIVQGHLDINGTAAQPVLLTRSYNYPAQNWSGLFFDGSQGDGSGTINHAIIEHAGSNFLPTGCTGTCGNGQTAVFVKGLGAGKQVAINASTLRDNVNKGLFVVDSAVNVTNTTFSQHKYPILIDGALSVLSYSGNTFSNNTYPYYDNGGNYTVHEDAIFINPGALMGHNFTLPVQNGLDAYVMWGHTAIPAGVTMTVDPGATVRMDGDKYLTVQGHLNAIGTQELPIHFTGIPGSDTVIHNWGGLYFEGTAGGGGGNLNHVSVESGGSNFLPPSCVGACGSAQTAVFVKDLPANKQLNISNSIIENSLSKGLYVVNSPTAQLNGNLIRGGRIGAYLLSNLTISNLALLDQVLYGVVVESGYNVDARHLTIARAGQIGFYTGGTSQLKNSILSHNTLAVKAEGSGQATLDTNLADANTTFKSGTVTDLHTINGSAAFEADGYHIQTTSAAIGNGLAGLSSVDIDGNTRPSPAGSLPDLGADEILAGAGSVPTVLSSVRADANPTSATSVHFTVTFSESVTGVNVSDFSLTTAGFVGAAITNVIGSGASYTVTVATGSGNGTIRLNVVDDDSIKDAMNKSLGGTGLGNGDYASGEMYTIEKFPIDVMIGGDCQGSYVIPSGSAITQFYNGVVGGPVVVRSTDGTDKIFASEHRNYQTSFSETLGYPDNQLTTKYWFTRYAYNANVKTWLLVTNPDPNQAADVKIYIGNLTTAYDSFTLPAGAAVTKFYDGIAGGPVVVESTNAVKIFASEHRNYQTSFSETLGFPNNQLTTKYWFTRYAYNSNVKTWLLVTNTDPLQAADVKIYIGNLSISYDSFSIPAGTAVTRFYDGIANGPVVVESTNGVKIFASEHRNYQTSFSETLGFPNDQLTLNVNNKFWFTRYAYNSNVKTWILVTNTDPNQSANVSIYVGDLNTPIESFSLPAGTAVSKFYDGTANGPVVVRSTNGVQIFASEHRNYQTSFSESLGFPDNQLTTKYWFARYAYNANVKTWILITMP